MAKQMGVPIGKLCAGVNINGERMLRHFYGTKFIKLLIKLLCCFSVCVDITNRVIKSGEFYKKKIKKTLSDAINIEVVSAFLKNHTNFHCCRFSSNAVNTALQF